MDSIIKYLPVTTDGSLLLGDEALVAAPTKEESQ